MQMEKRNRTILEQKFLTLYLKVILKMFVKK